MEKVFQTGTLGIEWNEAFLIYTETRSDESDELNAKQTTTPMVVKENLHFYYWRKNADINFAQMHLGFLYWYCIRDWD